MQKCAFGLFVLLPLLVGSAAAAQERRVEGLRGKLAAVAEEVRRAGGGQLGIGTELLETGEQLLVGQAHQYPMQSVYKMPIAMAVLARVDAGALRLDQDVRIEPRDFVTPGQYSPVRDRHLNGVVLPLREVLRLNVSESDGTACDVLLDLVGGPAAVTAWLQKIDVPELQVTTSEKVMGARYAAQFENWTTPRGALAALRALHEGRGLTPASRTLLLKFMSEGTRGNDRIGGALPAGTPVAHKPGTSGSRNGVTAATNDIGIVTLPDGRHLAVAVLLTNSRLNAAKRDAAIARAARTAFDFYSSPPRGVK